MNFSPNNQKKSRKITNLMIFLDLDRLYMEKGRCLSPLLSCLYFLLRNHDSIVTQVAFLLIVNSINELVCQPKGKHLLFILMQIFRKLDDLLTLCSSGTTFNLTVLWCVYLLFFKFSYFIYCL